MTRVLFFPGASLMDIRPIPDGVEVRCPGCGAVQTFAFPDQPDATSATFQHEAGCRVYKRIRRAIAMYERAVVRWG
jgi:hypothetical protein